MNEERSYGLETIPTWTLFFLAPSFAVTHSTHTSCHSTMPTGCRRRRSSAGLLFAGLVAAQLCSCSGFHAAPSSVQHSAARSRDSRRHAATALSSESNVGEATAAADAPPAIRRRPRGKHLKRDDAGVPVEAVYAPRRSPYLTKKGLAGTKAGTSGGSKRVRPQGLDREDGLNNAQKLRVLGGAAKGRRLESPEVSVVY
jgi:hypothetical protein